MIRVALAFILLFQNATANRNGSISGQLKAIDGTPAVSVRVGAILAPGETTRPSFGPQYYDFEAAGITALTDNQGRYQLTNVPPGRYFIASGPTFYPSTMDADRATVVTVTPGANLDRIDFQVLRALGGKVSGRVAPDANATPVTRAVLSGPNLQDILDVPVARDGSFEFGHVPTGTYWIDLFPPPPGMGGNRVTVGDKDVTNLDLVRPVTRAVSGRIVVQNGPLPRALLAFSSPKSYVAFSIKPDGTFSGRLHAAKHHVELAGMPVGYNVASVRMGSQDASDGLTVGNSDVSGIVITVASPRRQLPKMKGKITGLASDRLAAAKVQITGPIVGSLEAPIRPDGSFEFAALTPGLYSVRLSQVPELTPMNVVVTWSDTDVEVAVPGR